jgi:hypothetical protein
MSSVKDLLLKLKSRQNEEETTEKSDYQKGDKHIKTIKTSTSLSKTTGKIHGLRDTNSEDKNLEQLESKNLSITKQPENTNPPVHSKLLVIDDPNLQTQGTFDRTKLTPYIQILLKKIDKEREKNTDKKLSHLKDEDDDVVVFETQQLSDYIGDDVDSDN